MASEEQKTRDFYAVLGLKKDCTASELRIAYKKLAMRWHPDRCSASGNSKFIEEAKKKFQAIQEAYSVLSDPNKRFMYDVGVYDSDDNENGMGDFLNEMASMMSQTKPNENGNNESFEQLQELFEEMFQMGAESFSSTSQAVNSTSSNSATSPSYAYCGNSSSNKCNSSDMNSVKANSSVSSGFDACFQSFCVGAEHQQSVGTRKGSSGRVQGGAGDRRRHGRKQKVSSGQKVSSSEYSGISTR